MGFAEIMPFQGGEFNRTFTLGTFTITGIRNATEPAFINSIVAAPSIRTVKLHSA